MSTLWIWTQRDGIQVLDMFRPADCDGAKIHAAPFLGGDETVLCCHSFDVDNGSKAGKQIVFLVWVCDDYELLLDFLNSAAGERYAKEIGDIPPPFGIKL